MDIALLERKLVRSQRRVVILERMIEDQLRELFMVNVELSRTGEYNNRLIESMMDSLLVLSPLGKIARVNWATTVMLGYEPDELFGQDLGIVVEEHSASAEEAEGDTCHLLERLLESGILGQREMTYIAKDGMRIPVLFSGSVLLDRAGEPEAIVCIARDITERKQAEEYTKALLQASPVGILVAGEDGKIELVNDELVKLFGYEADELMGQPIELLVPERSRDDHVTNVEEFMEAAKRRSMAGGQDIVGLRKDGSELAAHVGLASTNLMGRRVVVAGILDRTEYHETERQRRRLENETSRLAGMSEVATGVLHNVGNVVNSVNISAGVVNQGMQESSLALLQGVVELFSQHSKDKETLISFIMDDPRGRRFCESLSVITDHLSKERTKLLTELDSMQAHVQHIMAIIDSQQEFARTTVGVSERVDMKPFMEKAVSLAGLEQSSEDYHIQCHCDGELYVSIDAHKLMQILVNLLGNARHAVATESIDQRVIDLRARQTGENEVIIEVEDLGVGIPEASLARVFEHGYTTKVDGHGFGLHISATAAMDLGGSLVAHSEGPGRGAIFTLTLPVGIAREK